MDEWEREGARKTGKEEDVEIPRAPGQVRSRGAGWVSWMKKALFPLGSFAATQGS